MQQKGQIEDVQFPQNAPLLDLQRRPIHRLQRDLL